eukprot:COSAG03_NODE_3175_length_2162_cov_11.452254_1_plen_23_part_10
MQIAEAVEAHPLRGVTRSALLQG